MSRSKDLTKIRLRDILGFFFLGISRKGVAPIDAWEIDYRIQERL